LISRELTHDTHVKRDIFGCQQIAIAMRLNRLLRPFQG